MYSPHKSSTSSQKKPSLFIRFVKSAFFQMFVFFTTIILLGVGYAAWTTLNVSQGADGQPVTQTLMQGIINNINDLNSRVQSIETKSVGNAVDLLSAQKTRSLQGTIACSSNRVLSMGLVTAEGYFDNNGTPHIRLFDSNGHTTGWVSDYQTYLPDPQTENITLGINGITLTSEQGASCVKLFPTGYFDNAVILR